MGRPATPVALTGTKNDPEETFGVYKLAIMTQKKTCFVEVVLLTKSYNLQDFIDWMHWHLDIIGFPRAHVFDNESSVDIKSVCDTYHERVTYELVKGWPNQYALYNRYINNESPALWVLPIDDDEFLYVSDKYQHNITRCLLDVTKKDKTRTKVAVGWRNMFPTKFTETRTNEHLILNATGWSDKASEIWQVGNRPVKTFVLTKNQYEWTDRKGHSTHDPLVNGEYRPAKTIDGKPVKNSWQETPTNGNADMILYHYQFRCNEEWKFKCEKRTSAGCKAFKKNFPELYKSLYKTECSEDTRMVALWNG